MAEDVHNKRILLTGATGYVGGRMLPELVRAGYPVRCLARNPAKLPELADGSYDAAQGDLEDVASLSRAMDGVHTAFYLVHSLTASGNFEEHEARCAQHFASAARDAGVQRIIYLGGLAPRDCGASAHLSSRNRVGEILRTSGVQTIEFQASIILGCGSTSFELIRTLVAKLPVMVTPTWVREKAQPIAIADVVRYLLAAIELHIEEAERVYQIGGTDEVSYQELMDEFARARGYRRFFVQVPVLTPSLSARWLRLVTPLYASVGRRLIEGVRYASVVRDRRALHDFDIQPVGAHEAIEAALREEEESFKQPGWAENIARTAPRGETGIIRSGARLVDQRQIAVPVQPEEAFDPIRRIGGKTGWYYATWLWYVRGFIDRLIGGPGMSRGRQDPYDLHEGDTLDCWTVEQFEPGHRLRLHADMKLPGEGWLEFTVEPMGGETLIRQTAVFYPRGALGHLYWYAIYPLHELIFKGMLNSIGRAAQRHAEARMA